MDQLDIPQDDESVIQADFFVPDINSPDPEERKLARRIRIEKREAAYVRQKKTLENVHEEKQKEKPSILQNQLEKSSEILRQLVQEAELQVTNVSVANDVREQDRRDLEDQNRQRILQVLQEDAKLSREMFEEISKKWLAILQYNDPLHIHQDLLAQKEKCNEMLSQKESVITMLKQEIREAEAKFYRDQQTQNDDISMLAKRVEQQVIIMRKAHSAELQNIEDVMILERENMMENNIKRWDELYKRREEQELSISENKIKQKEEFDEVVSIVRTKHYEKIREVKISLEKHCANLMQEYEYVKACAMTNSEKMDYNYQILKKREAENIIIKSNQKRTINKLQDIINKLKHKAQSYEEQTNNEIKKQYNEILNLKKCVANVKMKSKSLSITNDKQFEQLWDLNARKASEILNKLLTINKLIHEQQLGLEFEEPRLKLLKKNKLPSYIAAKNLLHRVVSHRDLAEKDIFKEYEMQAGYRRILKNVLEKIADKSGFLVEAKVKQILNKATDEEGTVVKVDNVFEALGMVSVEDINLLLRFFKPYVKCPVCLLTTPVDQLSESEATSSTNATSSSRATASPDSAEVDADNLQIRPLDDVVTNIVSGVVDPKRMSEESDTKLNVREGECLGPVRKDADLEKKTIQVTDFGYVLGENASVVCFNNHPQIMNPASVLRALREFVTGVMCTAEMEKFEDPDLSKVTPTVSRLLDPNDVRLFWERYKAIVAEGTTELWDALYYGLQKYHLILEERHRLNRKLLCLRKQNMELKHLLKRFNNGAKDLKPPCAVERKMPQDLLDPKIHVVCTSEEIINEIIVKKPYKK